MTDETIAVQPTGRPRLEQPAGAPPVNGTAPTPPETATDPAAPQFEVLLPTPKWEPREAAQLVTGTHNAAGGLYLTATNRGRLFEQWRAEARELEDSSAAIARLLDRVAPPGSQGPVGLLGDSLMAANGIIAMVARHMLEVRAAEAKDREAATFEPGTVPRDAAPAKRPPAAPPPPPRPAPSGEAPPRRGYSFPAEYAAFLGAIPDPHNHPVSTEAA